MADVKGPPIGESNGSDGSDEFFQLAYELLGYVPEYFRSKHGFGERLRVLSQAQGGGALAFRNVAYKARALKSDGSVRQNDQGFSGASLQIADQLEVWSQRIHNGSVTDRLKAERDFAATFRVHGKEWIRVLREPPNPNPVKSETQK